ncbi:MAG TPA: Holliday junction resolvase RuvX [Bacteroidales bacterium]|nr:Holliday junction resolvase RuvX [Bacteroidales bacterium]
MARLLAIDYGQKRTGLAVSDPLQITATPLATVPTMDLLPYLKEYLSHEEVELVILGQPKRLDGSDSDNAHRVEEFRRAFEKRFTTPIIYYDERFTSTLAHQAIIESGIGKKRRQDKSLVDRVAATIILQSYMESKH